ncbi:MAG: hypothetical protein IJF54_06810 [Clostridia bacterium]|nr:hypothetical protein [Clostridia bacterium]
MKDGFINKTGISVSDKELELINKLTRRPLNADEIYTFSVVLCDNEIDRDFERFSVDALNTLAQLYVGKSGIFDHSMKGRDQTARIFSCEVEKIPEKTTKAGEVYHRLKARAYMPKTEKNKDLILEIDAGIKKEVSVGCSVASSVCSVCGADMRVGGCTHRKGKKYKVNGKTGICHAVLSQPTDAFEWSFVAVPAQPQAGVVKSFAADKEVYAMHADIPEICKSLCCEGENVTLSAHDALLLKNYIDSLQNDARIGREKTDELRSEVVALCMQNNPKSDENMLISICEKMSAVELNMLKSTLVSSIDASVTPTVQLQTKKTEPTANSNRQFMI